MKTKEYIKEIEEAENFGSTNAIQIIKALSELDKSIKDLKVSLKEIPKQLKYFWQTLDELKNGHTNKD